MALSDSLWTLPIGVLFGLTIYPPVERWAALCYRLVGTADGRRDMLSSRLKLELALIAILLHPAPWLLLIGVPFVGHALWTDPSGPLWLWFSIGAVVGSCLTWAFARWRDARRARAAAAASAALR